MTDLKETIRKRDELTKRLMKALETFPLEKQLSIITSFLSLEELEEIVKFQER